MEDKLEKMEHGKKEGEKELTTEEIFEGKEVLSWTSVCKKFGWSYHPFTRQENTVIETCVVAISGIAFSSGYASYMLGMTKNIADQGPSIANTTNNVVTLDFKLMFGFLFVISFLGLFSILPLRKIMIIDYKLTYPSGTATALLINSVHTPKGEKLAKEQVRTLFKWFGGSFVWALFQWFFTGGNKCGFASFPILGRKAFGHNFYFDFSTTYVGVGMITPHMINLSLLLGSIVSWGLMWPLIEQQKGKWYSADLPDSSLSGMQGYRVFTAIAMILGDGLFQFVVLLSKTLYSIWKKTLEKEHNSTNTTTIPAMSYDDQRRTEYFLKDQILLWFAALVYVLLAVAAIIVVPILFPSLKYYHIMVIYIIAPVLTFCNSYGTGLSYWSLASTYGKLSIFIFGAWVGSSNGGIIAGLAACGVMMNIVSTAADLMQDFKTGYLTLASPRSMFASQLIGTIIDVILSPLVFWFFFYNSSLGQSDSSSPAPFGVVYRGIALIAIEGVSGLPKNCLALCIGCFLFAVLLKVIKEVMMHFNIKAHKYVPSAMAMAIPFYLGGYFAIDMCVGSLYRLWKEWKNKDEADAFVPAVASGMICGDSLWGMPASILSSFNVKPPLCMKFFTDGKVVEFLKASK
ncbi:probable metal-nicotianamine transporter YSL7 [Papaver somniferum]|uniref:probable metal-nicotianamine transporter YSL7 n=1 Tax=Papaver somniferum TaxID=3469 RepID=UPI000E6FE350|nr:probable metal-nicotianamine transporter YSL7 [Papaver somniferum]